MNEWTLITVSIYIPLLCAGRGLVASNDPLEFPEIERSDV